MSAFTSAAPLPAPQARTTTPPASARAARMPSRAPAAWSRELPKGLLRAMLTGLPFPGAARRRTAARPDRGKSGAADPLAGSRQPSGFLSRADSPLSFHAENLQQHPMTHGRP